MQDMLAAVSSILTKVSHIEKRTMNDNIKPHAVLRTVSTILQSFDPNGDVQWPLSSIRDSVLDITRTLSVKYPRMSMDEAFAIGRLTFLRRVSGISPCLRAMRLASIGRC